MLVGLGVLGAVVGEEEKAPVAGPEAVASPSAEEEAPAEDAPGEAQEEKGAEKAVEEIEEEPQEEKEDGELPGMVGENLQFAQTRRRLRASSCWTTRTRRDSGGSR
ncbi:hypothetical protein ACFW42_17430 [Streptomyces albidoflavus]